ncbi:MAG TPA: AlkA N-terminal domain-containing protein [Terriglobales bacterium]|nr:AlkA N-terminal domain-containing protein [Terriglobales bacterium]
MKAVEQPIRGNGFPEVTGQIPSGDRWTKAGAGLAPQFLFPKPNSAQRGNAGSAYAQRGSLDQASCLQALHSRDRRFDGRFFVGALTTKVYCRSTCPKSLSKPSNAIWFLCARTAEDAGFRPCKRCRPGASPGTPAWRGTAAIVSRALRLILEGALDHNDMETVAEHVGVGARQLRRLFVQHLGVSPLKVASTHRIHRAMKLIEGTDLPMAEIAFCAGFKSIRQFNHAVREASGRPASQLRTNAIPAETGNTGLTVHLPFRPPFHWTSLVNFLQQRTTPGVEAVCNSAYARTIETGGMAGVIEVKLDERNQSLAVKVTLPEYGGLVEVLERVRRMFDLHADTGYIGQQLSRDSRLKGLVEFCPGLRVPGAWGGFEIAVRAILGQRLMSIDSSRAVGLLVQTFGRAISTHRPELTHLFPRPEDLAEADIASVGIGCESAAIIRSVARAVSRGEITFDSPVPLQDLLPRVCSIDGIGEETAHYIAMRAFGEPDAFLLDDNTLRRGLCNGTSALSDSEIHRLSRHWRPWRTYAAMYLWAGSAGGFRNHSAGV